MKKPSLPYYSQKEKKEIRDLVITDLIHSLAKAKDGTSLRFGELGTFTKTKQKIKIASPLLKKATNKTYLYYRIGFRASSVLKRELDK
jgi:nucleoid DNA-binding protein